MPSPGYVVGDATSAMLVVAPVMLTVPLAHAPSARADPPMLPVVPASGRLDFTKASDLQAVLFHDQVGCFAHVCSAATGFRFRATRLLFSEDELRF
jgi:hypothetical protein